MITCPEAVATISADSSGANQQATGTFPADLTTPAAVPATPFILTPGGSANSLQLRTVTTQCIYEFTVSRSGLQLAGCGGGSLKCD